MADRHQLELVIVDDTGKGVFGTAWVPLVGTRVTGVLKDQPAQFTLYCSAWVKLVKFDINDSIVAEEELGPEAVRLTEKYAMDSALYIDVFLQMFEKRVQFAETEILLDVLAREGFRDPFVKEVSTETDIGGGKKEVLVTAYSGAMEVRAVYMPVH